MELYLRILRYSPAIVARLIQFLLFSVLGIVLSLVYMTLLIPMLNILFGQGDVQPAAAVLRPDFSLSIQYPIDLFNFHFQRVIEQDGPMGAVKFICIAID